MATARASERDLKAQIRELSERHRHLQQPDLFVLWFLVAFVTDSEQAALDGLAGGPKDKSLDALVIDDDARVVTLVQGKLRFPVGAKGENRNDVLAFAELTRTLTGLKAPFVAFAKTAAPAVAKKLTAARSRVLDRRYAVRSYYVTTGRCSGNLADEAESIARRADAESSLKVFDGRQVLVLLADYLDGVAPPVLSLNLAVEGGEVLRRYDAEAEIESWIFSMSGRSVAQMFEVAQVRLFARNIRGFLGSTEINSAMEHTLTKEPAFFWYYNNGITIVCDEAEQIRTRGEDIIQVSNPQVINGQQTTRTLAGATQNKKASVLVRVIRVPRTESNNHGHFDKLVSAIVSATNSQNAVLPSDLMSNDRRQIEIERQLRKLDYGYVRKRQTKGEARRSLGLFRKLIKKDELARAVAACELDPLVVREGKEGLFDERYYKHVFPTAEPYFYLLRYWLMREVSYAAGGYPERAYAKWVVLHAMWDQMRRILDGRHSKEAFRVAWEKNYMPVLGPLHRANDAMFRAASQFYRARRGKGPKALDPSTFFKRKALHTQFTRFWAGSGNSHRGRFKRAWGRFQRELTKVVAERA